MSKENLNRESDCFGGCSSSACFVQGLMEPYPSISLKSSIRTFPKHPQNQIISLEMAIESKDIRHGDPCHDISLGHSRYPAGNQIFAWKADWLKKQSASFIASATGCPGPTITSWWSLKNWRDILHLKPRSVVPICFPVNHDSLPFNQSRCGKRMNLYDVRVHFASFCKRLAKAVQNVP